MPFVINGILLFKLSFLKPESIFRIVSCLTLLFNLHMNMIILYFQWSISCWSRSQFTRNFPTLWTIWSENAFFQSKYLPFENYPQNAPFRSAWRDTYLPFVSVKRQYRYIYQLAVVKTKDTVFEFWFQIPKVHEM